MSTQSIEIVRTISPVASPRPSYLMCSPRFFDVNYVINPWMADNVHAASPERAAAQWQHLHNALSEIADVTLIDPQPGLPDMVFTANAGLERNGIVIVSSFFHSERQGEELHFARWFEECGYTVIRLPQSTSFEGEGDALFSLNGGPLWAGYGRRSTKESHLQLAHVWNVEVVSLHLIDPRFYHLDTCFAPLNDGYVMYYPAAFDAASVSSIEAFYPVHKRIVVSEADAVRFACNAINVDRSILVNEISRELTERLKEANFTVIPLQLSEFLKAGGAAKCLVMRLSPLLKQTTN
ncbi:dimethylarginine dimethylaminohydrolase family protein [Edaphobacter modestus]|uniref:N-dimethylarginine dimethylaminohydrolase n=1 Tax=Edaphobacter modestus TaxID=388466 RepID=A0A4V2G549_9BACT|nr:arginine deiminase-related protein [Edaphobacter modestus]RZU43466.1 N-dimethylarginine dimethylaminohydrolase [Edaphobacter modestus]